MGPDARHSLLYANRNYDSVKIQTFSRVESLLADHDPTRDIRKPPDKTPTRPDPTGPDP